MNLIDEIKEFMKTERNGDLDSQMTILCDYMNKLIKLSESADKVIMVSAQLNKLKIIKNKYGKTALYVRDKDKAWLSLDKALKEYEELK